MIVLISERQDPQLVPARNAAPIASTLLQPADTADASWLTPTLKQEQTMRPIAGIGTGGRPDNSARRSSAESGSREARSDSSHSRPGSRPGGPTRSASARQPRSSMVAARKVWPRRSVYSSSWSRGKASNRLRARSVPALGIGDGAVLLAGLFAAYLAIYFAVFGFLPSILSDRLTVGPEVGGMLTAVAVAVAAGAVGCLVCGQFLAGGVRPWRILLASFGVLALTGFGIFSDGVAGWVAYALSIVFSFTGGFIPVVLIDAVPRHTPRPELVGSTMGFLMQGNDVGFVLGPAAVGAIAMTAGWPAVSLLVAAIAAVAGLLILALRALPAEAAGIE